MSTVHLHLPLDHVPVIGTLLGVCLPAYAALRTDERLARASPGMFALLALAAVAAFLTGEPAEGAVEGLAGVSGSVVERHEEAAILSTIALGCWARSRSARSPGSAAAGSPAWPPWRSSSRG